MKAVFVLSAVGLVVGGVVCSISKNPLVRLAGGFVFGLLSLAATAGTVFLVNVGIQSHWSSDGPGMLFVMIAIGVLAIAAVAGWRFTASLIFGRSRER